MCSDTRHVRRSTLAAVLAAILLASPSLAAAQHGDHGASPEHAGHTNQSEQSADDSVPADHPGHAGHEAHESGGYEPAPVTEPERAAAFPDLGGMQPEHARLDDPLNKLLLLDRFETQRVEGGSLQRWDLSAWVGKSLNKLWIRSEGERSFGATAHSELELLWGKTLARWWELLAGARSDFEPGPTQNWAAVGVQGTTPYRVNLEATAYVGDGGRAAFRVKTHYELLVTNRLILQPLAELNWYGQRDAERGMGAGLANAEIGLRLRYEIKREVAPYVGLVTERKFGGTADLARAAGHDTGDTKLVVGIRLRF